jgi:hypothetical protein
MSEQQTTENKFNSYLKFVTKVFLKHLVWIFPLVIISFSKGVLLGFCALCLIVSFTYWEFEKFKMPFKLKMHFTNDTIKLFYNLAVWPLFFLTAWAIFEGIKNNYSTGDSFVDYIFPIIYAIGLTSILVALTFMIKTGKKWLILALIYIVFDFPGAMPYNYLFFHEKLKAQNGFDMDFQNYKTQMDTTVSFMAPIISNTDNQLNTLRNRIKIAVENSKAQTDQFNKTTGKPPRVANVKTSSTNVNKLSKLVSDSSAYAKFKNLQTDWTNSIANLTKNRKTRILAMNKFKQDLNSFTNGLVQNGADSISKNNTITYLKAQIKKIDTKQKTQLEAIQDLFIYTKSLIGVKSIRALSKEEENFTEMCLLPSIIIDLLPLLFSIVYAKWNETKETLEI